MVSKLSHHPITVARGLWLFTRGSVPPCPPLPNTGLKFYFQLGRDLCKVGAFSTVFAKFQVA